MAEAIPCLKQVEQCHNVILTCNSSYKGGSLIPNPSIDKIPQPLKELIYSSAQLSYTQKVFFFNSASNI